MLSSASATATEPNAHLPAASVVVITYNRPDLLERCLAHLRAQDLAPIEIVVVDSSPHDDSRSVVERFAPLARYIRNDYGVGTMATSRNIALRHVVGDVIAFIDDDAMAHPSWLRELLRPYGDPAVGGVGGRVRNGQPGEEHEGGNQIGMLLPNGTLTGNFAADPGRPVRVDHLLGASMSFRREVLDAQGGIHDLYPGPCLREDTDIALRAGLGGWLLIFAPDAVVDHLAGPYARGRRFDLRYTYFTHRNHMVLLRVNCGPAQVRRYAAHSVRMTAASARAAARTPRSLVGSAVRFVCVLAGLSSGAVVVPQRHRPRS